MRPDLLGSVTAYFDDDEFTEVAYFTSEEEPAQGEAPGHPDRDGGQVRRVGDVMKVDHYLDITDPWLTSA